MARLFNGTTQYVEVASAAVTAAPMTMACWIKPATTNPGQFIFRICKNDDWLQGFGLLQAGWDGSLLAFRTLGGSDGIHSVVGGLTAGAWHHVAGVTSSPTSRFAYRNGAAGGENTTSATPVGINHTEMGRLGAFGADYYGGAMAEQAVWNVALSGPEISALAAGASPMSLATLPVRYWRFKENGDFTDLIAASVLTNFGSTWTSDHPTVDDPPIRPVTAGMFWF